MNSYELWKNRVKEVKKISGLDGTGYTYELGTWIPDKEVSPKTIKDVVDSMTEEQKTVMYAIIGQTLKDTYASDNSKSYLMSIIKKVIFNGPATIILWADGSKTVVKCGDMDIYDPEKGLAMAICKYVFGNDGTFKRIFRQWVPENPWWHQLQEGNASEDEQK